MSRNANALALVFGGCCLNALSLEQLTGVQPGSGTLLTFLQFALVALTTLPNVLSYSKDSHSFLPRISPRKIPILVYLRQVALFYVLSRLNNAAFAYDVPMSVHIVFRSGGVVISLLLGWIYLGRSYTIGQILSVLAVFVGVFLTTISVSSEKGSSNSTSPPTSYMTGIALLALALFLSGILGITQDQAFATCSKEHGGPPPWKEAMFYLHALGLPLFLSSAGSLRDQFLGVMTSKPREYAVPDALKAFIPLPTPSIFFSEDNPSVRIPSALPPLLITLLTSLPCSAGANRLASSMTSTSVALVLAARKATSLLINTAVFGTERVKSPMLMASGAAMVFAGSVGWAYAGIKPQRQPAMSSGEKKTQ